MLSRLRIPEIVLGAMFTVAVFAMGMTFESLRHPPQKSEQRTSAEKTDEKAKDISADKRIADYTMWLAIFTGLLVAVSGVQGYFLLRADKTARITAKAAKTSIALARKEFAVSHRPRVILREVYCSADKVWFRLVSTGDSKATIVESWFTLEVPVVKSALRPLLSAGHDDLGRLELVSGEMTEQNYTPPDDLLFILKAGEREGSIFMGDLYFMGAVVYTDSQNTQRRSVFCRQWRPGDRRFARLKPEEERDNEYAD